METIPLIGIYMHKNAMIILRECNLPDQTELREI